MREPTSSLMVALEVLYALSPDNQGSGIPKPPHLTLWPNIFLKLFLTSSPLNSAGGKVYLRASSIGPIRVPTMGKVLCMCCHLIFSDIPNLA